jgi:hypothetical protein
VAHKHRNKISQPYVPKTEENFKSGGIANEIESPVVEEEKVEVKVELPNLRSLVEKAIEVNEAILCRPEFDGMPMGDSHDPFSIAASKIISSINSLKCARDKLQ